MEPYQEEYIANLREIAALSPRRQPSEGTLADYTDRLCRDRARQKQLAARNMALLRENLFPVLDNLPEAGPQETEDLRQFAAALIQGSKLIVLDEPVSGMDQNGMELFYRTIYQLKEAYDLAVILISHDLEYVRKYADKVILLDKTVLKQGSVKEVFQSREFAGVFHTGEEPFMKQEGSRQEPEAVSGVCQSDVNGSKS